MTRWGVYYVAILTWHLLNILRHSPKQEFGLKFWDGIGYGFPFTALCKSNGIHFSRFVWLGWANEIWGFTFSSPSSYYELYVVELGMNIVVLIALLCLIRYYVTVRKKVVCTGPGVPAQRDDRTK